MITIQGIAVLILLLKSCKLLGIAYAELNLKADAVETDDLFRSYVGVGGEVQERFCVFNRTDHDTDVAFQCPRMYDRRVTSGFVSFGILIYE